MRRNTKVALVIIVILVVIAAALQFLGVFGLFNKVTLQGTADPGVSPDTLQSVDYIKFTDVNGHAYTANIDNGIYSIEVPNNTLYSVTIGYTADSYPGLGPSYGVYSTACSAGTYNVQDVTGRIVQDFYCF